MKEKVIEQLRAGFDTAFVDRLIKEELNIEINVGNLIDIVEYDYPEFHLSMNCFLCTISAGEISLIEHEDAKWLTKETLDSVDWLAADQGVVEKICNLNFY